MSGARALAAALIGDLWAMEPNKLTGLVESLQGGGVEGWASGYVAPQTAAVVEDKAGSSNPVAEIPIHGVIMKKVPAIFGFLGVEATSTTDTAAAIRAALEDDSVESIELSIDSPGGTIAGVQPLADLIHEASKAKPVHAKISDMAASAAYWLGSQASSMEANPGAMVGSIGVYRVMIDSSEKASKDGLRVHLVSSGEFKGAGAPGTEIQPKHIEREQRIIDQAAEMFVESIARGRNMDLANVSEWATGETWFSDEAQKMGLIDMVSAVELPESVEKTEPADFDGGKEVIMEETIQEPAAEELVEVQAVAMEQEIAELKAALEAKTVELEAKAAEDNATKAALKAVIEGQKEQCIAKGVENGQIVPAMVEQVQTFAEFCGDDVAKLEAFVEALPVQVRPEAASEAPAAAVERVELSDKDKQVAKLLGIEPEAMATGGEWRAVSVRGELLDQSGAVIGNVGGN